jgi:hypothetical protein
MSQARNQQEAVTIESEFVWLIISGLLLDYLALHFRRWHCFLLNTPSKVLCEVAFGMLMTLCEFTFSYQFNI